jgi:acyl-coenzyme A thioesterase PaaI-like protein
MTRDFYYHLDTLGTLTIDGAVQDDPWFLDFFFRRLAPTANPHYQDHPFVSRCGDEMNYLRPDDTPIVYTHFDGIRLYYGASLNVLFHADRLSYSPEGILYHWALVGERGRLVPQIAMEIAKHIKPWGPFYAFHDEERQRIIPLMPLAHKNDITFIRPREDNQCVVCGEANPHTFFLTFVLNNADDSVRTYLRPDARMQGSLNVVHGGYVSLLLDETMGKCLSAAGIRAPTAQLNVRFRQPMLIDHEYEIHAYITEQDGRKNYLRSEIRAVSDSSTVIAEADALFLTIQRTP